jgi:hypothetical protein
LPKAPHRSSSATPMTLLSLIERTLPPIAWQEGDNISWNDPGFSQHMLKEHLSQGHDWASPVPRDH